MYYFEVEMRISTWLAFGATALLSWAYAAEPSAAWKPLRASFTIFAGQQLAEREAPTAKDRKLAIAIEGQPAREIFDSIGPDRHPTCSQEKGDRDRRKGGVQCTFSPKGDGNGYRCWIGVNLRTGGSIATVSC
ncbi:hypothetical protein [Janthinobacterium sp. LB2P10]|uniref:hypothetical protein n=1 Tax=Janthinobacterium sp. LB2P10 TaxID=3424194 RepID=UPI003F29C93E